MALNGQVLTVNGTNFSDVKVYGSTALRNAAATVEWHQGDVAIVDTGTAVTSYYYDGTDGETGITVDADWSVLHSPADSLTGSEIITAINQAATSGVINVNRLNAAVLSSADGLQKLFNVSDTIPTVNNSVLMYSTGASEWQSQSTADLAGQMGIQQLANVTVTNPANGQFLTINSAGAVSNAAIPVPSLDQLGDTDWNTDDLADGQIISWDDSASRWKPITPSTGVTTLAALSDTVFTGSLTNDLLTHNGTSWVNTNRSDFAGNIPIESLSGITVSSPAANQILAYKTTLGNWENVSITDVQGGIQVNQLEGMQPGLTTALAEGDFLLYDLDGDLGTGGGAWVNHPASTAFAGVDISNFKDVTVTTPAAGQILVRNAGNTGWVNQTPADVPASAVVADTAPSSPAEGDLWYYTGDDGETDQVARLFIYYNDGTTGAWVATTPSGQVPDAPAEGGSTEAYALQVGDDGVVSWVTVAAAQSGVSLKKEVGQATPVNGQTTYAVGSFMTGTVGGGTAAALTAIAENHTLHWNGLLLAEGFDYSVSGTTITLTAATAAAINPLTTGDTLTLTNVTAVSA